MEFKKKLTDFLAVEDGSIARKSMMLTGAVLSISALGELVSAADESCDCCECPCGPHSHFLHTDHEECALMGG